MELSIWQSSIVDEVGAVVPYAQVEVRDASTGDLVVPIYANRAGSVEQDNPFSADVHGFAAFYAPAGRYKITASFTGITRVYNWVPFGTAAEHDAGEFQPHVASLDELSGVDPSTLGMQLLAAGTQAEDQNLLDVYSTGEVDAKDSVLAADIDDAEAQAAADLAAHVNDPTAAHAASAVSFAPTGTIAATDTQTAVAEVASEAAADLAAHVNDATAAHAASAVGFTPTGTIAATDTQTAVAEVASEAAAALAAHLASGTAHAAVAIVNTPAGNIAATDAQTAINELDTEKMPIVPAPRAVTGAYTVVNADDGLTLIATGECTVTFAAASTYANAQHRTYVRCDNAHAANTAPIPTKIVAPAASPGFVWLWPKQLCTVTRESGVWHYSKPPTYTLPGGEVVGYANPATGSVNNHGMSQVSPRDSASHMFQFAWAEFQWLAGDNATKFRVEIADEQHDPNLLHWSPHDVPKALGGLAWKVSGAYRAVTAAVNQGGIYRATIGASTTTGISGTTGHSDGDILTIRDATPADINGTWEVDVVDATHVDLIGSVYAGDLTVAGKIQGTASLVQVQAYYEGPFCVQDLTVYQLAAIWGSKLQSWHGARYGNPAAPVAFPLELSNCIVELEADIVFRNGGQSAIVAAGVQFGSQGHDVHFERDMTFSDAFLYADTTYMNWIGTVMNKHGHTITTTIERARFGNSCAIYTGLGDGDLTYWPGTQPTTFLGLNTYDGKSYLGNVFGDMVSTGNISGADLGGGEWVPVLTKVANISGTPVYNAARYIRRGAIVDWSLALTNVIPAVNATFSQLGFTLPIASDFVAPYDAIGNGSTQNTLQSGVVMADETNNRMELQFNALGTGAGTWLIVGQYIIR